MRMRIQDAGLEPVAAKVLAGERLSFADGVALFESNDILTLGQLANLKREERHGNLAFFNVNRHLNPTNVCWVDCQLCAWDRKLGEEGAYTMTLEQAFQNAAEGTSEGVTEFHIVGGLHPRLPFTYYVELLRGLKERFPKVHLKAFTMVEIDWLAKMARKPLEETIAVLHEAGMDSCPGGGAEIFAARPRQLIAGLKISGERWLEVARAVHQKGIKSNATILYGHVETMEERVDHFLRLRDLQDETNGFQCLIPLAFHPENTVFEHLPETGGMDDLKVIAVARLLLDNFPHIKSYWIQLGARLAQVGLRFGADDLDGTIVEERITHAAGGRAGIGMTRSDLEHLIREAGRIPVERTTLYERVEPSPQISASPFLAANATADTLASTA